MTAASEGHISIIRLFLQHNANTEIKDSQGWKASDHAVIHGHHRLGKHAFFNTGIPLQSYQTFFCCPVTEHYLSFCNEFSLVVHKSDF